jgi:hypothetical protein
VINVLLRNQTDSATYHQKYFRPSSLPALNLRFTISEFLQPFVEKTHDQIHVPVEWTKTPEDTQR